MQPDSFIARVVGERFRVQKFLGRGGMSRIYTAQDLETDQTVALKLLKEDLASDRVAKGRFLREVNNARRLKHKNIVRTFDAGEFNGRLYMAMEFMDGGNMGSLLRKVGTLPWPIVVHALFEISSGLMYSHNEGIIHRDMKPDNVMLNRKGGVKIADFGISRSTEATQMTKAGEVLGTPAYMAPEQVSGGTIDMRTDVFSTGILIYEFLVGHNPFRDENLSNTALKIINFEPPRLDEVDPLIPRPLADLVESMLSKDQSKRPRGFMPIRGALQSVKMLSPVEITHARFVSFMENPPKFRQELNARLAHHRLEELVQAKASTIVHSRPAAYDYFQTLLAIVSYAPHKPETIAAMHRFLRRWEVNLTTKISPALQEKIETYAKAPEKALLGEIIQGHESAGNTIDTIHHLGLMAECQPEDRYVQERITFHLDRLGKRVAMSLDRSEEVEVTRVMDREELKSEQVSMTESSFIIDTETNQKSPVLAWALAVAFLVIIGQTAYIVTTFLQTPNPVLRSAEPVQLRSLSDSLDEWDFHGQSPFQQAPPAARHLAEELGSLMADPSQDSAWVEMMAINIDPVVMDRAFRYALLEASALQRWDIVYLRLEQYASLMPEASEACEFHERFQRHHPSRLVLALRDTLNNADFSS